MGEELNGRRSMDVAGGYIRHLLMVDFIIFLICILLVAFIVAAQPSSNEGSKWVKAINADSGDWQIQQTLFFCQFLYGLCSFPFIFFKFPFLSRVLTHTSPTAYNSL